MFFLCYFFIFSLSKNINITGGGSATLEFDSGHILTILNPFDFDSTVQSHKTLSNTDIRTFYCHKKKCSIKVNNPAKEESILSYSNFEISLKCDEFHMFTNINDIKIVFSNSSDNNANYTIKSKQDICFAFAGTTEYLISMRYDIEGDDFLRVNDKDIRGVGSQIAYVDLNIVNFHTEKETESKYADLVIKKWSEKLDSYSGKLAVGEVKLNKILTIKDDESYLGLKLDKDEDDDKEESSFNPIIFFSVLVVIILAISAGIILFFCDCNEERNNGVNDEDSNSEVDNDAYEKELLDEIEINAPEIGVDTDV